MSMNIKVWERNNYKVYEREFNYDLHKFVVVQFSMVQTIIPNTIEDMNQIITDLDSGLDVNGWDDGVGNTIETQDSMWERLKFFLEDKTLTHSEFIDKYEDMPVHYQSNGVSGMYTDRRWYTCINPDTNEEFDFYLAH